MARIKLMCVLTLAHFLWYLGKRNGGNKGRGKENDRKSAGSILEWA